MSAKEDLQRKIQSLEDQLKAARHSLNQILIDDFELKEGDKVREIGGRELTVSSVQVRYGRLVPYGRLTRKDGSLGRQEYEIFRRWERI